MTILMQPLEALRKQVEQQRRKLDAMQTRNVETVQRAHQIVVESNERMIRCDVRLRQVVH